MAAGLLQRLERLDIDIAAHQTGGGPGPMFRGLPDAWGTYRLSRRC